jgi:carboxymethylenebutenolidase
MMAVKVPTLSAAVPYYGGQPTAQEAEQITTLLHYAGLDSRVNEGWPAYEAILRKNNIENTAFIYPESIMVFITIQHQGTMMRRSIMESNNRFF